MTNEKDKSTALRVFQSTKNALEKLRVHHRETHDDILRRLLGLEQQEQKPAVIR